MKTNDLIPNLFSLAIKSIDLMDNYKKLSKVGRFEALLFNTSIVLNTYRSNRPITYSLVQDGYFDKLNSYILTNRINADIEDLSEYINNRFVFYAEELNNISTPNYIPGKVFNAFYGEPFCKEPEFNFDLPNMILFGFKLKEMGTFVNKGVNYICKNE